MRLVCAVLQAIVLVVVSPIAVLAQSSSPASVPRLINITGSFRPADGQPLNAVEAVTLSLYADQEGGTPLWQETQSIALDERGRYALLLGGGSADGIPPAVFASGEARWLGTRFERAGEAEQPRMRITSVPYSLRAADADTLGGRPASAYLLAPGPDGGEQHGAVAPGDKPSAERPNAVLPGTTNFLAKYVNAADVGDSALYESAGAVGLGTTTPFDRFHVRFTDATGGFTGLVVQNLASTATSYSGMLFYDQAGVVGQFQGFNNSTHEYRINNVARNGGGLFNGSINFMTGSTSRFVVTTNGNIGIGTTAPSALLEVSNAVPGGPANMWMTSYTNALGPYYMARRARGTPGAPTAVQNGDGLAGLYGQGYGTTAFGPAFTGGMTVQAAQNWTDTAQGTALTFTTTSINSTSPVTRMTLDATGNLGIGTSVPEEAVEIARTGNAVVAIDAFGTDVASGVALRTARGTQAAPTVVQRGDALGYFVTGGWDGIGFADAEAGLLGYAAEDWTPTTRGAGLGFFTTPIGLPEDPSEAPRMVILPSGEVGIGTPLDVNGLPTATDKLQVFGDIRVGTTGTNGCLKDFGGNPLAGTCASDRRFKKDITPFGHVLDRLTALQPVHYFWRASEFPDRQFGHRRAYGLIAQDAEQVLPELVVTNDDGFKAVDYSELPLLTIQAVKDLKSENDALKARVAELERLVTKMLATTAPRP